MKHNNRSDMKEHKQQHVILFPRWDIHVQIFVF